jgi:hypothetical protein
MGRSRGGWAVRVVSRLMPIKRGSRHIYRHINRHKLWASNDLGLFKY